MTDVRALQVLLDGGVTDPRALMAAMPTGTTEDVQRAVEVLSPMAFQLAPVEIPNDGLEHECPCGEHLYRVADHVAWGLHPIDLEGRWAGSCWGCGRELTASKPFQSLPEEEPERCHRCDLDTHRCPGCGVPVDHGTVACSACDADALEDKHET